MKWQWVSQKLHAFPNAEAMWGPKSQWISNNIHVYRAKYFNTSRLGTSSQKMKTIISELELDNVRRVVASILQSWCFYSLQDKINLLDLVNKDNAANGVIDTYIFMNLLPATLVL